MSVARLVARLIAVVCLLSGVGGAQGTVPIPANHIRIHYYRSDAQYTGWTVYALAIRPKTRGTSTVAGADHGELGRCVGAHFEVRGEAGTVVVPGLTMAVFVAL